jgi:Putative peptidoglycan binding domain/LysM domain
MGVIHTVSQGEHLSGIALRYGFRDYRTIWNDPGNADLKQRRPNPHVLFPGDQLVIPDKMKKQLPRPTDQGHRFQVAAQPLDLRIRLEQRRGDPIAGTPCMLAANDDGSSLTSDGDGALARSIAKDATAGKLTIQQQITVKDKTVPLTIEMPLHIGHLDPVDEASGQRSRLANLGYYLAADDPVDDAAFTSAVEEFQCDNGLAVDGICGPATQAKLSEIHGC